MQRNVNVRLCSNHGCAMQWKKNDAMRHEFWLLCVHTFGGCGAGGGRWFECYTVIRPKEPNFYRHSQATQNIHNVKHRFQLQHFAFGRVCVCLCVHVDDGKWSNKTHIGHIFDSSDTTTLQFCTVDLDQSQPSKILHIKQCFGKLHGTFQQL